MTLIYLIINGQVKYKNIISIPFFQGHSTKSDANHVSTESFSSFKRHPTHKSDQKNVQKQPESLTVFEKLCQKFSKDATYKNEIRAGKRLGFYRFVLDIGRGNFSKVKLALHSLVNSKFGCFEKINTVFFIVLVCRCLKIVICCSKTNQL